MLLRAIINAYIQIRQMIMIVSKVEAPLSLICTDVFEHQTDDQQAPPNSTVSKYMLFTIYPPNLQGIVRNPT